MTPLDPAREYPVRRLLPNMVTLMGLCCGLSAIRFAISDRWELAVALLVAAALIDGMDGRIARMLKSTSEFGAQLDSLSDFVCFGVAPAVLMYLWGTHEIRGFGWAAALFYTVCCALRLARFNAALHSGPKPAWHEKFFTGIPSPAGAMLCITPIVLAFEFGPDNPFINPRLSMVYMVIIGMLMASRVPTFAVKKIRVPGHVILPVMLVFGLYFAGWLVEPWTMFWLSSVAYILSIVLSVMRYRMYARGESITHT